MGSQLAVNVRVSAVVVILLAAAAGGVGCRDRSNRQSVILNRGSDTMINVAQGWAEAYAEVAPEVSVEVAGGGSGVGIAALIDGTVHIANSSRPLKADEIEKARTQHGVDPVVVVAGYDALAVFVHRENPVAQLTLAQIQAIYAEDGAALRWSDLGVVNRACARDTIVRLSRQSSSGTYDFFREVALGRNDFKLGTLELNGSKEVVELVSHTPCAIGYSGMGYAIAGVRMVPIAPDDTSPAIAPSAVAALDRSYPIARPLYVFTAGKPQGETQRYIEWILSDAGQRIVAKVGYVPLRLALDKS